MKKLYLIDIPEGYAMKNVVIDCGVLTGNTPFEEIETPNDETMLRAYYAAYHIMPGNEISQKGRNALQDFTAWGEKLRELIKK